MRPTPLPTARYQGSRRGLWVGLWATLLFGCSAPTVRRGAVAPVRTHEGVSKYYPLDAGTQWSFGVTSGDEPFGTTGEPRPMTDGSGKAAPMLIAVTRVLGMSDGLAVLETGRETSTLRIVGDTIVREPAHAVLLKYPTKVGDTWPGLSGAKVTVTAVDRKMTVPAGTFDGCIETTERFFGDNPKRVRTVFCPEVGPVELEVRAISMDPSDPEGVAMVLARLRSFGVPVELPSARKPYKD